MQFLGPFCGLLVHEQPVEEVVGYCSIHIVLRVQGREGGARPRLFICSGQAAHFLLQLRSLLSQVKSVKPGLPLMLLSIQPCLPSVLQGVSWRLVPGGQGLVEPHIWSVWPSAVWLCNSWLSVAKLEPFDFFPIGCIPPKLETPGKKLELLASALECHL